MKIRSREKISPIFRGCRNQKRKSATVLTESAGILPAATPHLWPWAFEKTRQNVKICMVWRRRSVFGMNKLLWKGMDRCFRMFNQSACWDLFFRCHGVSLDAFLGMAGLVDSPRLGPRTAIWPAGHKGLRRGALEPSRCFFGITVPSSERWEPVTWDLRLHGPA